MTNQQSTDAKAAITQAESAPIAQRQEYATTKSKSIVEESATAYTRQRTSQKPLAAESTSPAPTKKRKGESAGKGTAVARPRRATQKKDDSEMTKEELLAIISNGEAQAARGEGWLFTNLEDMHAWLDSL